MTPMTEIERVYRAQPSAEEIAGVLGQRVTATVGTLNEDGTIHLAYVLFLHLNDRFYFETASMTRKARNAVARPQASMLVQGHVAGRHLMVSVEGAARVLTGDEAHKVNHVLRAKYIHPDALVGVNRAWGRLDDVAVELTPVRQRSWTSSVLHEETQKELTMAYGDAWLQGEG